MILVHDFSEHDRASILVVDDNAVSTKKLAKTIAHLGHEPDTVHDGATALVRLQQKTYDVVLLDIVMPEMDGFEVLRRIQSDETLRDVPVIVISSLEGEIDSVAKALELGAEDFLPKSFDLAILRARLNSTLSKKRYRDRELAYLCDVENLAEAAEIIEAGPFRPNDLNIGHVQARSDELGRLARVFGELTQVIYERERHSELRARTLWGTIMVIVAGSLFASAPSLGRIGASIDIAPLPLIIWASIFGAVLCLCISLIRGGIPRFRASHVRFCCVWALLYGCGYNVWLVIVAAHVEATTISLIASSRAFIVFALAALISLERPNTRRVLGLGLGLAAVAAILFAQGAFGGGESSAWLLAALLLPVLLSLHTLLMAWRPKDLDAFATSALMLMISAALLSVTALGANRPILPPQINFEVVAVIIAFGAASSLAIAFALDIVAKAGAVFASQMAYIQTLGGIAWGMILLDEQLPAAAWGALVLVIAGFFLVRPNRAGDEFSVRIPIDRPAT